MSHPPCWPDGQPCPNTCAAALHDRTVHNLHSLYGPWLDWRMAGRDLVSPDGDRISPERLRGLLWRQAGEAPIASAWARKNSSVRKMVTVIRVDQVDWHRKRFGSVVA